MVLDPKHSKVSSRGAPGFSKLGMRIFFFRTFMDSRGAMNGSLSLEFGLDMMPPSPLAHVTYSV